MPPKCLWLVLLAFHTISPALGQEEKTRTLQWGASFHYGSYITDAPKAELIKDSYTWFAEAYAARPIPSFPKPKNAGPLLWGVAAFAGNTGSREYMGKMGGLYGFFDFGLLASGRFQSRIRTGLGIGLVEKPYDAETNHKNLVIGSIGNLFLHLHLQNSFRTGNNSSIQAGISFSHLSNATTKLPNLGINVPALSIGFNHGIQQITEPIKKEKFRRFHLLAQITAGVKQSPWVGSPHYGQFSFSGEASLQRSPFGKIGLGLAVFADPSQNENYVDDIITTGIKNYSTLNLAPYFSYEIIVGRISVPLQAGMYLLDAKKKFYQNAGLRFRASNKFSVGGYLKTHGGTADYLHGGLIYHIQ